MQQVLPRVTLDPPMTPVQVAVSYAEVANLGKIVLGTGSGLIQRFVDSKKWTLGHFARRPTRSSWVAGDDK